MGVGLGTIEDPFSARWYRDIQRSLSHPTLAQRGSHDARPSPGPLYIGRTDADFGERLSIKGSLGHFFYRGEHDSLASYSDVWNLVLRWAVTESTIVSDVEMVLIRAHKPNYNAKDIKGSLDGDLLVLNTGAKGHLLPVVSEWYFAPAPEWPTE
jgi:hypothetical protein